MLEMSKTGYLVNKGLQKSRKRRAKMTPEQRRAEDLKTIAKRRENRELLKKYPEKYKALQEKERLQKQQYRLRKKEQEVLEEYIARKNAAAKRFVHMKLPDKRTEKLKPGKLSKVCFVENSAKRVAHNFTSISER